ncbi:MAG TPA: glycoside hydrolase family 5 protein [Spirochaetota bacterium]|nr:glycoside hydrolase family 5 protein [Spirochaetota bacterium]HPY86421.1 glycoside hydrolase family 5 protein [Spirochaetota bacterium]HQB61950.1 glycoside hydrolase family 5 protein [Spirochaetota bacterium]
MLFSCIHQPLSSQTASTSRQLFTRAVNISVWLEQSSVQHIQFRQYDKNDFAILKKMGVEAIRLPIKMRDMVDKNNNYALDPVLLGFIDEIVGWAEELEMFLIIDNHSYHPVYPTLPEVEYILHPLWTQLAKRYKHCSDYIIFEVLNEPHGLAPDIELDFKTWQEIQERVVKTIRAIDPNRYIIIGGSGYNSLDAMLKLPVYQDKKLIYTFHFYEPFVFTHQGANWGAPTLEGLANVPFPPSAGTIPAVPKSLKGTWIEGAVAEYKTKGTPEFVKEQLDAAIAFAKENDILVFCGELGVYRPYSKNADQNRWLELVTTHLEQGGIMWSLWDVFGRFGIFQQMDQTLGFSDLDPEKLNALRFKNPHIQNNVSFDIPQTLVIYDDYAAKIASANVYVDRGSIAFYNTEEVYSGKYAIKISGLKRYSSCMFNFSRMMNFAQYRDAGYGISFWAKTKESNLQLQVRLRNPYGEIPWRMSYKIDNSHIPADNKWHEVFIPFSSMEESGAWKDKWFDPKGKFDWRKIETLEFVSEFSDMLNLELWIDEVKIDKP